MAKTKPPLPFSQTHCAACGYSLRGLGSCGRCPECGAPYDDQELILFGWSATRFASDPIYKFLYIIAICSAIFLWIIVAMMVMGLIFVVVLGPRASGLGGVLLLIAG